MKTKAEFELKCFVTLDGDTVEEIVILLPDGSTVVIPNPEDGKHKTELAVADFFNKH